MKIFLYLPDSKDQQAGDAFTWFSKIKVLFHHKCNQSNINVRFVLEWIYISHLLFDISHSVTIITVFRMVQRDRAKPKINLEIFTTFYRKYSNGLYTVTESTQLKQRIICHAKQSKNKIKILPVQRRQSVHSTLVHRCSFSLLFWPLNQ